MEIDLVTAQFESSVRRSAPPRMVLEAAGEDAAGLIAAVERCLDEIGAGEVLEVVAGLEAIPFAVEWCVARDVELLHLAADRQGGRFWVRRGGRDPTT